MTALALRFEEIAREHPNRCAVLDDDGREVSYRLLRQRASRLAQALDRAGVRDGARVGVHLDRGIQHVETIMAIVLAGGAYVPLPVEYPTERLAYLAADADLHAVATDASHGADVTSWFGGLTVVIDGRADVETIGRAIPTEPSAEPLACLLYTSGSTGLPKGVGVSVANVAHLVVDCTWVDLSAAPVIGQVSNAAFDAMTFEVWGALLNGGTLRIVTGILSAAAPKLRRTAGDRPTMLFLTTGLFNRLARGAAEGLHGVTTLLFGGELADSDTVCEFVRSGYPGRLLHVYGPTETTTFATYWDVDLTEAPAGLLPVGTPLPDAVISIRDADGARLPGAEGEVWIGGNGVTTGYWRRDDLTRQRFVTESDATFYRSGDLGMIRSVAGRELLVIQGRLDDQFKHRGYRIEPAEIESALRHQLGGEAVVTPVPTSRGPLLGAFLVHAGVPVESSIIRQRLARALPPFMIPDVYLAVDTIPLTPNGKIDRDELRSHFVARTAGRR